MLSALPSPGHRRRRRPGTEVQPAPCPTTRRSATRWLFGYQSTRDPGSDPPPPSAFDHGYVDAVGQYLRALRPAIRTVNYGCPGETDQSFIAGGRPWTAAGWPLHDDYAGGQLAAAVAFLGAHPGQVSPITLTVWGNDVAALNRSCADDLACIAERAPVAIAQLNTNLATILSALTAAAPNAEILVTGPWDSFIGSFAFADPLFAALDASIANTVSAARRRYVDLFPAFNPQDDPDAELAAMCSMTLLCSVW